MTFRPLFHQLPAFLMPKPQVILWLDITFLCKSKEKNSSTINNVACPLHSDIPQAEVSVTVYLSQECMCPALSFMQMNQCPARVRTPCTCVPGPSSMYRRDHLLPVPQACRSRARQTCISVKGFGFPSSIFYSTDTNPIAANEGYYFWPGCITVLICPS